MCTKIVELVAKIYLVSFQIAKSSHIMFVTFLADN